MPATSNSLRKFLCSTLFVLCFLASFSAWSETKPTLHPIAHVVELFTSQSCSSCPPADQVLYDLSANTTILAIAQHVDYWNHLHWVDVFSSPEASVRQRAYAKNLESDVYTPQMVIDGRTQFVGTRSNMAESLINAAPLPYSANLKREWGNVVLGFTPPAPVTVWMVTYQNNPPATAVTKGENRKRTLITTNPVISMKVMRPAARDGHYMIPDNIPTKDTTTRRAVIVQQGNSGAILAAAWVD